MAIVTKAYAKNPDHQFLQKRETDTFRLSSFRREYIKLLTNLYYQCFRPNIQTADHILPLLDSPTLDKYYQKTLIGYCYSALAKAVQKHFFNEIQQLVYGSVVIQVPDIIGNKITIT